MKRINNALVDYWIEKLEKLWIACDHTYDYDSHKMTMQGVKCINFLNKNRVKALFYPNDQTIRFGITFEAKDGTQTILTTPLIPLTESRKVWMHEDQLYAAYSLLQSQLDNTQGY